MRAVYKNPKELATKLKDVVDLYFDDLITYEKLKETVEKMIKANKDSIYKDGFMPVKLISALGEDSRGERTFSLNYIFKLDEAGTPMVYERVYNNDYMSSNTDSLNSIIKNYIVMWGDPKENDTWSQKVIYNGKEYSAKTVMTDVSYTKYNLETTITDIDGFYNDTYIEKRTYDRGYGLISFENTPAIDDNEISMNLIFGYTLSK